MADEDCADYRQALITLPPQRINMELPPEEAIAVLRREYGLNPGDPINGSERVRSEQ